MTTAAKKAAAAKAPVESPEPTTFTCARCGTQFLLTGDGPHPELVEHEQNQCEPAARTPLDRARLLINGPWDRAEDEEDLPTDAVSVVLLAIAEELRSANIISLGLLTNEKRAKIKLELDGL